MNRSQVLEKPNDTELEVQETATLVPDGPPIAETKRGTTQPFLPDFAFKEALAALLVIIVLMLVVVYSTIPTEPVADPTDTSYIPRPEWYFLFLFQALKYFPGSLEPVATVLLPGIAISGLILLPFLSRKAERRPSRRPVAMVGCLAVFLVIGYLTWASITSGPEGVTAAAKDDEGVKLTPVQVLGRKHYRDMNCSGCHSINGAGATSGPDLGHTGSRRDLEWLHTYVENPKHLNPNSTMPGFLGKLSHQKIEELSWYLLSLK